MSEPVTGPDEGSGTAPRVSGIVLAAGAGRRYGMPKALAPRGDSTLLARAVEVLARGGCAPVLAVLGARAEDARALLPSTVTPVVAADWDEGMGASLRAGLHAAARLDPVPDAALLHLVDLPDVGPEVVARVAAHAAPDVVARATYGGVPGHPVLLGRRWWQEVAGTLAGDTGAKTWLANRPDLVAIDCSDLATGIDTDTPTPPAGGR